MTTLATPGHDHDEHGSHDLFYWTSKYAAIDAARHALVNCCRTRARRPAPGPQCAADWVRKARTVREDLALSKQVQTDAESVAALPSVAQAAADIAAPAHGGPSESREHEDRLNRQFGSGETELRLFGTPAREQREPHAGSPWCGAATVETGGNGLCATAFRTLQNAEP